MASAQSIVRKVRRKTRKLQAPSSFMKSVPAGTRASTAHRKWQAKKIKQLRKTKRQKIRGLSSF